MTIIKKAPCLDVLDKFLSAPKFGEFEKEIEAKPWDIPKETDEEAMKHFPFLYVGEGHNRIYVVNDGKVIWTYDTGIGTELDDVWMLSNGNILFSHMAWCAEVTPDKKQVWYYEFKEGSESHSLQPVGLDKVLMVINSKPPRAVIIDKKTGEEVYSHEIPYDLNLHVHTQFRRIRLTADNTFILPYLAMGKVVEYDMDFNEIWSVKSERPWSAFKLHNGNVLITDENELAVKEVDRDGKVVWSVSAYELPSEIVTPGVFDRPGSAPDAPPDATSEPIGWQSCVRLANGNTVLCSQGNFGLLPQFIEIDKDKKVVWTLKNWKDLGPATTIQVLNEPGIPENPGECER